MNKTLEKLLNIFENTKLFFETLKEFSDFDQIIENNLNNLNIAFKESQKRIINNNYDEEINDNLNNKLIYLKEITLDYYNKINGSYYDIKQYLKGSIQSFDIKIKE